MPQNPSMGPLSIHFPTLDILWVIPVQDIMKNIPISGLRDSVRAYHGDHHRFRWSGFFTQYMPFMDKWFRIIFCDHIFFFCVFHFTDTFIWLPKFVNKAWKIISCSIKKRSRFIEYNSLYILRKTQSPVVIIQIVRDSAPDHIRFYYLGSGKIDRLTPEKLFAFVKREWLQINLPGDSVIQTAGIREDIADDPWSCRTANDQANVFLRGSPSVSEHCQFPAVVTGCRSSCRIKSEPIQKEISNQIGLPDAASAVYCNKLRPAGIHAVFQDVLFFFSANNSHIVHRFI